MEIQDLYDDLGLLLKNIANADPEVFILWADFIDRHLRRRLIALDATLWYTEASFTTPVAGTAYPLPATFGSLTGKDAGFYRADSSGNPISRKNGGFIREVEFASTDDGYRLKGDTVIFTKTHTNDVVLNFIPKYVKKTDIDDTLSTPDAYYEQFLMLLEMFYHNYDESYGQGQIASQKFLNIVEGIDLDARRSKGVYRI